MKTKTLKKGHTRTKSKSLRNLFGSDSKKETSGECTCALQFFKAFFAEDGPTFIFSQLFLCMGILAERPINSYLEAPPTPATPSDGDIEQIGRAVQQECRDRSRMPSSA
eukprot:TRINITY_DN35722_c0_g3_i4.p1 TRINITY_DN35722_c0_g3~~TRINITY_DN35722_c0_g3_i4.p1  ORF type:complete len:109 (+),score=19.76 TRINITY_DN35722_c0_g3_i4:116-442(+)